MDIGHNRGRNQRRVYQDIPVLGGNLFDRAIGEVWSSPSGGVIGHDGVARVRAVFGLQFPVVLVLPPASDLVCVCPYLHNTPHQKVGSHDTSRYYTEEQ